MKGRRSKKERGVALLIALFALMLLAAVAFEMMYVADTETLVNRNFRDSQRSYDAAWSGIQEARERLMPSNTAPHLIAGPATLPGGANSIIYVTNPRSGETIDPTTSANRYFDNELCHENFAGLGLANPGIGIPCTAGPPSAAVKYIASDAPFTNGSGALDYKWVRITQKANNSVQPVAGSTFGLVSGNLATLNTIPICWDGTNQIPKPAGFVTCDDNPPPSGASYLKTVYLVTSLAITPTGARRMAQMEVALDPPFVTNAAVDSQDHVNLNGQLGVNGYDNCSCLCTTVKVSGKDVTTCTSRPGKTCDNTKWAIYSNNTVDNPGASETIIAGPSPAIAQNASWPYDINSMVDKYKNNAGTVNATQACPSPQTSPPTLPCGYGCSGGACGTQSGQTFGVPPTFPPTPPDNPVGPPNMTPYPGQITYVPGNLQITAGSVGNGILVVDGNLDVHGGLQFYGLILVKGVISFTGGGSDKTNIYGAVLAGQSSVVDTTLGGSAVINFDACALTRNTGNRPPNSIAFRELQY